MTKTGEIGGRSLPPADWWFWKDGRAHIQNVEADISKMPARDLAHASAVVQHASRGGAPEGSWLAGMITRKPRMLISVTKADKTARIVWAVLTTKQDYRAPMVSG
jgi:hypothetical protein